jgi:predicted tellurium resistance membrane protein TerC
MNGNISGINPGVLAALYLGLLLFGIGFNALTAWAERNGYMKGYTSLFVVVGVGVTVAATAVINIAFALFTAVAFVASGLPMIAGSIWRHMQEREAELERLRQEALDERVNWRNG